MKTLLKRLGLTVLVLFALIQFFRPARTNPAIDPARSIEAFAPMTPGARAVYEQSCRDCHSHETRWPWYSHVAPASWFLVDHVNHARSHVNLSEWAKYDMKDARHHLEEMCEEVREGKMPLPSYLWIHRGSRPSPEDVEALCAWTESARRALEERARDAAGEDEVSPATEDAPHRHNEH